MDASYRVTWNAPGATLNLRVEVERAGSLIFAASLALERAGIDGPSARGILARFPLMTLQVSTAIYREALRLLLRGTPAYRHPVRRSRSAEL